jgi:hypothetical protein
VISGYPATWEQQLAILAAARLHRNGLPWARTLVDLGSTESVDKVRQALIAARRIHRVNPLWLQQTAVRLHRPGQAGTRV